MSSSSGWLSDTTANKIKHSYINGFLDVSGSNTIRGSNTIYQSSVDSDWNIYGQVISGVYESDIGSNTNASVYFGQSLGMDASGSTIAVGAPNQDGANTSSTNDGCVTAYRYDTTAGLWYQLGNIITGETNSGEFGYNVDLNYTGDRIMATDPTGDYVNVYDYNSSSNTWVKNVSITGETVGLYGGRISKDGNTVLFSDYTHSSNKGKIVVYRYISAGNWTKIGEFTGDSNGNLLGLGSAISYDGNRVTLNERAYDSDENGDAATDIGRVRIFEYSGTPLTWNQLGNTIYGKTAGNTLAESCDFSKDGSIVALGTGVSKYAEVYQYNSETNTWNPKGSRISDDDASYAQGVRLSDDGTTLLINDYSDDTVHNDAGAFSVFKYVNNDWVKHGSSVYGVLTSSYLGFQYNSALAISGDGSKIIGGGYGADLNNNNSGYVQAWQWSQKNYTKPLLDANNQTMTIWGGVEHNAKNYSVTPFGSDITEYKDNGNGAGERSNILYFSSDGTTLFIGHQLGYNNYSERTGSFRVMKYNGERWLKKGSTIAPRQSEVGVFQGTIGHTTIIGGGLSSNGLRAMGNWENGDTDASTEQKGLIRVYDFTSNDWVQVGNDIEGDSAGDLIREGMMSGDGNTVAYSNASLTYAKIRTYNSSTNTWDLQTTISTGNIKIRGLSYDGTIRMDRDTSTSGDYKVTTHKYANGSWSQIGQGIKSYEVDNNEDFNMINLSKYGDYMVVGDRESFSNAGVVRIYKYSSEGDIWMQMGGNIRNPFSGENSYPTGCNSAISADGKTLIVTDYLNAAIDTHGGTFAVYKYFDGVWTQIYYDKTAVLYNEQFANGAAMCDNGEFVAVSSGGQYYARVYKIANNPALKTDNGITTLNGDSTTINSVSTTINSDSTIINNGNVGIGTTNPEYPLTVNGITSSTTRKTFDFSGSDNYARHFWICSFKDTADNHDNILIKINYSTQFRRPTGNHSRNSIAVGTVTYSSLWHYHTDGTNASYNYNRLYDQKEQHYSGQGDRPKWYFIRFNGRGYLLLSTSISDNNSSNYRIRGNIEFLTTGASEETYVWNGNFYRDSDTRGTEGFTSISELYPTSFGTGDTGWDTTMASNSTAQEIIEATEGAIFSDGKFGIHNDNPEYTLDVASTFRVSGGSKISVQNGQDGGNSRGIFLWRDTDPNWGLYMAHGGSNRALDGGTAPEGWGFGAHAVRLRTVNSSTNGFIFENNANQNIFTIRGNGRYWYSYSNNNSNSSVGLYWRFQCPKSGSPHWDMNILDNTDNSFDFDYNGSIRGYINAGTADRQMNTFTGQHICEIRDITFKESEKYIGLIVSANNNEYLSVNNNVIKKGIDAIEVEESVPIVSLTRKQKDKSCFGVISKKENDTNRSQPSGSWVTVVERELGDNRTYINSLGEGAIWVSNAKGNLESGDYITTSMLPGYGEKQDDDLLHNYTVAKITMDCNFQPALKNKLKIKRKDIAFYTDASNNTFDMSDNLIYWGSDERRENVDNKKSIQEYNKTLDISRNVISVTQNILNDNGDLIWEETEEQERAYHIRHLDPSGNIITEEEYNTKIAASEEAYIAAFVGCTYHCG